MLPYAAVITASTAIQKQVAERYNFVSVVTWGQEAPFVFYGLTLFLVMIVSVATGFGSKRG